MIGFVSVTKENGHVIQVPLSDLPFLVNEAVAIKKAKAEEDAELARLEEERLAGIAKAQAAAEERRKASLTPEGSPWTS